MTNEEMAYFEVLHNFINTMTEIEKLSVTKDMKIPAIKKLLLQISDAYIILLEG